MKANYGIDAPVFVRNLFLAGALGVSAWTATALLVRFFQLHIPPLILVLTGMAFGSGILCTLMGLWMIWDSKIGKVRSRERLLDRITWTGREHVLDVGCGRGLLLIGAAKRLTTGKATGIDIWQAEDLSGNRPEVTMENARREGVAQRVEVETADIRQMPFADCSFDVVVSRAVIHNLYKPNDRTQAVREIARVLKPGGQAVIEDIRHHSEYRRVLSENGCSDVRVVSSSILYVLLLLITWGGLRPATLVVRKSASQG